MSLGSHKYSEFLVTKDLKANLFVSGLARRFDLIKSVASPFASSDNRLVEPELSLLLA